MPIYEYRCENEHTFDVLRRMTDDPITACEVCGAPVSQVFHPIAVHFKGSGFYNTDYGTKNRSREVQEAGEGGSSSDGEGSSSEKKKDGEAKKDGEGKKPEKKATETSAKSGSGAEKSTSGGTKSASSNSG